MFLLAISGMEPLGRTVQVIISSMKEMLPTGLEKKDNSAVAAFENCVQNPNIDNDGQCGHIKSRDGCEIDQWFVKWRTSQCSSKC